jgi:rhodanese-related sulfurtransferase
VTIPLDKLGASPYRTVDPAEAERLVAGRSVRVLDVRTPPEFENHGHIPGSILFPVQLIASAPAGLRDEEEPLLVVCEHGVRSEHAAAFLALAGYRQVSNMAGGMAAWTGPRDHGPGDLPGGLTPEPWLVENANLLPPPGEALDVACGGGRHTLLLAAAGFRMHAVDRDGTRTTRLKELAGRLGLSVRAEIFDLEADEVRLPVEVYDLVLVFSYLHRPLFPALVGALRPGGVLIYETFPAAQAERGQPTNPAFLLQPGELTQLVSPLEILRSREGDHEGRMVASVVARKPPAGP